MRKEGRKEGAKKERKEGAKKERKEGRKKERREEGKKEGKKEGRKQRRRMERIVCGRKGEGEGVTDGRRVIHIDRCTRT